MKNPTKTKKAWPVLTEPQQKTLAYLFVCEPRCLLEMQQSKALNLSPSAVPQVLRALQVRGLIRRHGDIEELGSWRLTPLTRELMSLGHAVPHAGRTLDTLAAEADHG